MACEQQGKRVLVAVTGASGSLYAERLVSQLLERVMRLYVIVSATGQQVCRHELPPGALLRECLKGKPPVAVKDTLRIFAADDFFAPVASGSSVCDTMVIVPCSMGTLARIAGGFSTNLIERAADVMLKQKKPLILVPRETPFNGIHLRNMLTLHEMGCHILPAMPGFYQKPQTLEDIADFVVGKILEAMDMQHQLYAPWNPRML